MNELKESSSEDLIPRGSSKQCELKLGNTSLKVSTDVTPATMKAIKEIVELEYGNVQEKSEGNFSPEQLTLLVAYNLAEELCSERARLRRLKKAVLDKTERLINRVESHLSIK